MLLQSMKMIRNSSYEDDKKITATADVTPVYEGDDKKIAALLMLLQSVNMISNYSYKDDKKITDMADITPAFEYD